MKETLPWHAKTGGTMQVISRLIPCMEPTITADSTADRAAEDVMAQVMIYAAPLAVRNRSADSRMALGTAFS